MSKRLCGVNQNWISAELAAVIFLLINSERSQTTTAKSPFYEAESQPLSIPFAPNALHSSGITEKLQTLSTPLQEFTWTHQLNNGERNTIKFSRAVFLKQLNFLVFIRLFANQWVVKAENENREKRSGEEKLLTFFEAESRFCRVCMHSTLWTDFHCEKQAARRRASDFNCHGEEVNRIINYISYVCNYTFLLLCC